ncbi:hypothetical protein JCM8097_001494 [Rhodosporidiobolus ruineniae]
MSADLATSSFSQAGASASHSALLADVVNGHALQRVRLMDTEAAITQFSSLAAFLSSAATATPSPALSTASPSSSSPSSSSSSPSNNLPVALSAFAYTCALVVLAVFFGSYAVCWYRIREADRYSREVTGVDLARTGRETRERQRGERARGRRERRVSGTKGRRRELVEEFESGMEDTSGEETVDLEALLPSPRHRRRPLSPSSPAFLDDTKEDDLADSLDEEEERAKEWRKVRMKRKKEREKEWARRFAPV